MNFWDFISHNNLEIADLTLEHLWMVGLSTFFAVAIGIPLGILLMLIYFLVLFVSGPTFGYFLGRLILAHSKQPVLIMLVGSAVLLVLYFIPIISFFAAIAAIFFGSGIFLSEAMRRLPKPTQKIS